MQYRLFWNEWRSRIFHQTNGTTIIWIECSHRYYVVSRVLREWEMTTRSSNYFVSRKRISRLMIGDKVFDRTKLNTQNRNPVKRLFHRNQKILDLLTRILLQKKSEKLVYNFCSFFSSRMLSLWKIWFPIAMHASEWACFHPGGESKEPLRLH